MSIAVCGLDISLRGTGIVILQDGQIMHRETIKYKPVAKEMTITKSGKSKTLTERQKIERLLYVADRVVGLCAQFGVQAIAREDYAYSKSSSSVTGLAEVTGVLRTHIYNHGGAVLHTLGITQSRKLVMGVGTGSKAKAKKWLQDQGYEFDTDDEYDAFMVAFTLYYIVNKKSRGSLSVLQLEYLDELETEIQRKLGVQAIAS